MDIAIVPDSAMYLQRDSAKVDVVVHKDTPCIETLVSLTGVVVTEAGEKVIFRESRNVKSEEAEISAQFLFEVPLANTAQYTLVLVAKAQGCGESDQEKVSLPVLSSAKNLVNLVIVWHNHQPPNYTPSGRFFADYPFKWVWYNLFEPYASGGPYYVHVLIYKRFPKVKTTVHLSPSLLAQWVMGIEKGYALESGEVVTATDRRIELVKQTLEEYKSLATQGIIEVMSSVYAHTILGYLLHKFDMVEVIRDELELGLQITRDVMGVEPYGVWTPEMAWHNKLIEIYSDLGVEYTVLCSKSHFTRALGNKNSAYEPYKAVYNGKALRILFRDQVLSDMIGFRNNFVTSVEALKAALDTVLQIVSRRGLVTIALDGENWMIFSRYPRNTYPFFEQFYKYVSVLQEKGFIKSTTGHEASKLCGDDCKKILYIPVNSWVNGFHKWDGELDEQRYMWTEVEKVYHRLKLYKQVLGNSDKNIREAYWAFYHAIDSDYWWTEFWNPRIIKMWLGEVNKALDRAFTYLVS
uniref:Glycoside hydrolase family 57 N-terminal domain-containing protein n=1 Tax=Ignisphaera aggregans TaxID=334771 RepID=A0A7J3Z925_9CREN